MAPKFLPMDIITEEILPRTEAKSLNRFKCVSKSFNALISSPDFINHHLLHSRSSDKNHLIIAYEKSLDSLDLDSPEPRFDNIPLGPFGLMEDNFSYVVGSCNGLVCIEHSPTKRSYERTLLVFNPCNQKYAQKIDRADELRFFKSNIGFGYDSVTDDYKVVVITLEKQKIMVWSLRENKLRFVEITGDDQDGEMTEGDTGTLVDSHLLHWKFYYPSANKHRIRCFDVTDEKWVDDVPLPNYDPEGSGNDHFAGLLFATYRDKRKDLISIGSLDGFLCLVTNNLKSPTNMADVWIMREYNKCDSWVKLLSISYKPDRSPKPVIRPLAIRQRSSGSQVLVMRKSHGSYELVWFNIGDKIVETLPYNVDTVQAYKGSLVNTPGDNIFRMMDL